MKVKKRKDKRRRQRRRNMNECKDEIKKMSECPKSKEEIRKNEKYKE